MTLAISTISRRELSSCFFFLQGKAQKEMHVILTETLGEHAPSYATVKNWTSQFKRGDFSICDAPCPGRPTTVTTPEIIDEIYELILEDHRISAKSIAEQMGISYRGKEDVKLFRMFKLLGDEICDISYFRVPFLYRVVW